MKLTVIGCAGSFPGPDSPASCYLVQAEHEGRTYSVVLDLGNGALGPLQRHLDPGDLDAILLTHHHPDHISDMAGLFVMRHYAPSGPPPSPVPVYSPAATGARIAEITGALAEERLNRQFDFIAVTDSDTWSIGPFTITAYLMNHPVECYGYRVAGPGGVIAYSGDTDSTANLTPLLTGADLALVDCAFVDGRDTTEGIHLSGSRAGRAASQATDVQRLVLTHLPSWNDPRVCLAQARAQWSGPLEVARAGATYVLEDVHSQATADRV